MSLRLIFKSSQFSRLDPVTKTSEDFLTIPSLLSSENYEYMYYKSIREDIYSDIDNPGGLASMEKIM